jgi:NADPH:quinone reductase-like Zn-dependent oxidoreductase
MMKALTYSFDNPRPEPPALSLVELPIPDVKEGEVLVRIHYAGLSYLEVETSQGKRNKAIASALRKRAVVSGIEMAGTVASKGRKFQPFVTRHKPTLYYRRVQFKHTPTIGENFRHRSNSLMSCSTRLRRCLLQKQKSI